MELNIKLLFILSLLFIGGAMFNTVIAQAEPQVSIGVALRFNYNLSSWKPEQKIRGGDFGYDMFRINATAAYKGIYLNAAYRGKRNYLAMLDIKRSQLHLN